MEILVLSSFGLLCLVALAVKKFTNQGVDSAVDSVNNSETETLESKYKKLQWKFFSAYFLALLGDWLQGPYVYQLYLHYGFAEHQIALLFMAGFGSSSTFGTFTGPLADKFGRKKMTLVFCILYAICCVIKFSSNFWVLLSGRLLGGISTSLLFSVFESWYVAQHLEHLKLPKEWMSKTFATSTFANGLLAILAGVVANYLAENLGFGPTAPFALAVPCFCLCFFVVLFTWSENYGNPNIQLWQSYKEGAQLIWNNRPIFWIGLVQSIIESCMYIFVFLWTPVMLIPSDGETVPLGMIFSCFMVCIMIGSSLFSTLMSKNWTPGETLQSAATIFAACTGFCTYTAHPKATDTKRNASFVAFLFLETSIGLYFPSIGVLRSQLIPESHRATVTNWFRVPMNIITCATLLAVNHPSVSADKRSIFATCTGLLITGVVIASKFNTYVSKQKKVK